MITVFHKKIRENKLKTIPEVKTGSWVFVEQPTPDELKFLSNKFNLEKKLLRDALDPYEVPRIEKKDNAIYIFSRYAVEHYEHAHTAPLLIIVHDEYFITISKEKMNCLDRFFDGSIEFSTTQKVKLLIQLFLQIATEYQEHINEISKNIRNMSGKVEKIRNRDITKFVEFERVLNDFLSALVPTNIMLENLMSGKKMKLYSEDKGLVEDLFLNNKQLIDICNSSIKYITNTRGAYSTIMTNNLNKIMKLLTSLTMILTIPTMIYSFYGMNVRLPLETDPIAYLWILIGSAGIVVLFSIIFMLTGLF